MRSKQYAPAKYDAVAAVYDQRWQRYHADTLDRTARYVTSVPATAVPGTFRFAAGRSARFAGLTDSSKLTAVRSPEDGTIPTAPAPVPTAAR